MDEGGRFPKVAAKAGHYESFYIKACRPGGGQGIWIRHTVHKRPGAEPNASIWFVLFDRDTEGPRATKVTVPAAQLSAPAGSWIRVDQAEIGPGKASGSIETEALKASWDLTFAGDAEPCKYLPADWLYEAPVPKTKFVAPCPDATFSGRLQIDGEEIALDGWPGMIGHNWGAQHAERWIWLHGVLFEDRPDDWLDIALGRIRVGRVLTPWVANGVIALNGERIRIGGLGARLHANEGPSHLDLNLHGHDARLRLTVHSNRPQTVVWRYADPDGGEHHVANCSIAELEAVVIPRDGMAVTLRTAYGGTYELGAREVPANLPVQPFPDP
jgi:hypothetical protein